MAWSARPKTTHDISGRKKIRSTENIETNRVGSKRETLNPRIPKTFDPIGDGALADGDAQELLEVPGQG
jgi:hypothetical protein